MKYLTRSIILFAMVIAVSSQAQMQNPSVLMQTKFGNIIFEIYLEKAPVTAGNFLRYVDEDRWDGATFYRVVTPDNQPDNDIRIEVIQGGLGSNGKMRLDPIVHETTEITGIMHQNGTISMARSKPGTASSEFFICIEDQPELDFGGKRNPDGQGFAAFGKVIKGMEVVRKIQQQSQDPKHSQYLAPGIPITGIRRVEE